MITTDFTSVIQMSAKTVPLQIVGGEDFRFKGIVDQNGDQLAAVTDRYALVQNIDVARAVRDALYDNGIEKGQAKRGRAMYSNGHTRFDVHLPEEGFHVPGDPSKISPTIQVGNDYRGAGGLTLRMGAFREVCVNGMIAFVATHSMKLRHVGNLGYDMIYGQISEAVSGALQDAQDQREVAILLAESAVPQAWVDELLEETAKRYQPALATALGTNTEAIGSNAWAVAQAISEVATHNMPTSWAAEAWATEAVQALVREVQTA